MKIQSSKAKGKRLERWVCDSLKSIFSLTDDDIRATISSENGEDVKLSKRTQALFPFSIECKNREVFTTLYNYYKQAKEHNKELEGLLIIKMNRVAPLAILDAEYFFNLIKRKNNNNE